MADGDFESPQYGEVLNRWIGSIDNAKGVKGKTGYIKGLIETADAPLLELLRKTLKYAYDGSIRFGVSTANLQVPVTVPRSPRGFGLWVFTALDGVLATSGLNAKKQRIEEIMGQVSVEDALLVFKIVDKDLRCGINESTINKVFPDLLTKFDVMLAKPYEERHVPAWPVLVEPKLDGLRVIAEVDVADEQVLFFTRSGKPITSLDNFKPELVAFAKQFVHTDDEGTKAVPTVAFDGEVTSGTFLDSMSSVRKGDQQVEDGTFHIFDALTRISGLSPIALEDSELAKQGNQLARRQRLLAAWQGFKKSNPSPKFASLVSSYLASSDDEVMTFYARSREQGLEGVIIKDPKAYYVKKRSSAWLKIKAKDTLDLPIVGAFEGTGKYVGQLGGLIVRNGDVEVRVGGGFSDDQRIEYWEAIQKDYALIEAGQREKCVLIDCLAEVEFQEQLPSGSLRHPVFKRLRRDKQLGSVGAF